MARSFSSQDAKQRIQKTNDILRRIAQVPGDSEGYKKAVLKSVEAYRLQEAVKLLEEIPVEEINREKRGYRTKLLRECGYETLADLVRASAMQIAAINGIGDETARQIHKAAKELAAQAAQGVKIRLSMDKKTELTSNLILALSCYGKSKPLAAQAVEFSVKFAPGCAQAVQHLQPGTGVFKWLFASANKKDQAENAYTWLTDSLKSGALHQADGAAKASQALRKMDTNAAWQDFARNPILFINLLEELVPDALGDDKGDFGLPEDLAGEIAEHALDLTGLKCQLRQYQQLGVKYILHQGRVLLGDEMGLGKTVQAIAAMVSLRNGGDSHFAVVCPASVLSNWCREIAKHSDLAVIKVHGADREEALQHWKENGGVAVTTYETTGHFKLGPKYRFAMLIVDEAHYIKNPEAQRTKNVKKIGRHAVRMLFMTGTALENRVEEMVELMDILQPEVAKSVKSMVSLSSAPVFREKVAPVYYRRRRDDVLTELPEKEEIEEWCALGATEEKAYEEAVLSGNFAAARRVSWHTSDPKDSSKAQRLLELVEEAEEEGRKVIVFSFFLDTIGKVSALLGEKCMQPINGSVPPQRRQGIIDEFDKAPAGSVLAAQIQSGGTGLNIQSASVVIICEPQFKPSIENQAISRAYRMGQTRSVLVYRLLCEDTVDEQITELLKDKQKVFDAFADESVAGQDSLELDDNSFKKIMEGEAARIRDKNQPAQ